jgi:4-amino-4-deoxy-L-arabinose transferase-like glycosyltransferase
MLLAAVFAVRWRLMGRAAALALRPIAGLGLATGVCLLWLVPAYLQDGQAYIQAIVFRQTVVRFLQPWHHYQGPLYYFRTLPLDYLPWSGLALAGLVAAWKLGWKERRAEWLFPLAWVAVTVLAFSLSRGKRNVYLLPCFPALALLSAAVARPWLAGLENAWLARGATLAHAVLGVAGIGALVGSLRQYQPLVPYAAGLCGLTVVVGGFGLALHATGRVRGAFATALGLAAATFFYMYAVMAPACDFFRSARPFAEAVAAAARPGEPIAAYLLFKPSVAYYLDRRLEEAKDNGEMAALTRRAGGNLACILPVDQLAALRASGLDYVEKIPGTAGAEGLSFGRVLLGAPSSGTTTATAPIQPCPTTRENRRATR